MTDLVLFRLGWIGCLDIPKVHSQGRLDVNLSNCNPHVNIFFHLISPTPIYPIPTVPS